jgi:hypothetical protein
VIDEIVQGSHRVGKCNFINAPAALVYRGYLADGKIADFPNEPRATAVRGYNERIALLAAFGILDLCNDSETPAVRVAFFDDGKAMVDRCALWAREKRGLPRSS